MGGPMGGSNGNAPMGMGSPGQMGPGNIAGPKRSPMGNEPGPMGPGGPGGMPGGPGGPGGPSPGSFNKNSPIMGSGPTTTDPNYAQQFHDFQQQLYATNTSRGMRGNGPGPGPGPMGPGPGNFYGGGPPPGAPLGPGPQGPPGGGPGGPMSSSAK